MPELFTSRGIRAIDHRLGELPSPHLRRAGASAEQGA
jgi:hypothetical protein